MLAEEAASLAPEEVLLEAELLVPEPVQFYQLAVELLVLQVVLAVV